MNSIARRRGGKPYDPSKPDPQVHDRRATTLGVKVMVAPMLVPDPYATADKPDGKIVVVRNLRDDPLAERHARGTIDQAQYLAGRDYQRDFEQAGGSTVRAIDFTREAVDGGLRSDGLSDSRMKATDRLARAHVALGLDGSAIAQDVLVKGYSVAVVASSRGLKGKAWEDYFGKRFRECLDALCRVYNYSNGEKQIAPCAEV